MGFLNFGKHATFDLTLSIDDINNVPLVNGFFSVEWRFKRYKSKNTQLTGEAAVPERPPLPRHGSSTPTFRSTVSQTSSSSSVSSSSSERSFHPKHKRLLHLGIGKHLADKEGQVSGKGRGETRRVMIVDHGCIWEQHIQCGVQIPVGKNGELGARDLRLAVYQHLSPADSLTNTEKSILLGYLHLDLAEYAGAGKVIRRYLLDEGKTNATIKVGIELDQVGGQKDWSMKPLTKGQVAGGGLKTLVGNNEGSLTGTPALSSSDRSRLSADTRSTSTFSTSDTTALQNTTSFPTQSPTSRKISTSNLSFLSHSDRSSKKHSNASSEGRPPAVSSSTFIHPSSTEAVIEAIFNPVPSAIPGPFTVPFPDSKKPPAPVKEEPAGAYASHPSALDGKDQHGKRWKHLPKVHIGGHT